MDLVADRLAAAGGVLVPSWWGVALSLCLVVVAAAVVVRERLGLGRELLVAAVRAAVQLVAVGVVLRLLFLHAGIPGSLAWVIGMIVIAGGVVARRGRGLPQVRAIATVSLAVGVTATLGLLLGARVLAAEPRIVIPVGGMVVSAAMSGANLVMLRLRDEVATARPQVEARLALGLSGSEAFAPHRAKVLRMALTPNIDGAKVVGLITLPGAMTGLIIAGVSPLSAIRYQILVTYMGLGSVAITALVAVHLLQRALFDPAHRLRSLPANPPAEPAGRWLLVRRRPPR